MWSRLAGPTVLLMSQFGGFFYGKLVELKYVYSQFWNILIKTSKYSYVHWDLIFWPTVV